MSVKLYATILSSCFILTGGCDSKPGANQGSTPGSTSPAAATSSPNPTNSSNEAQPEAKPVSGTDSKTTVIPGLDACGLIEKSEIESVQGAKVQGTTPSKRNADAFMISQCFYTAFSADGKKDLSVHLEVSQNDPKGANQNAVGDLWREKFQGAKGTKKMEKPKPVTGVGDGAYWVGNNKSGALYALKKDKLFRISIGGPDDEAAKIQKTKALAAKALTRLE